MDEIDKLISSREHNLQMSELRINRLVSIFENNLEYKRTKLTKVKELVNIEMIETTRKQSRKEIKIANSIKEMIVYY